ncbi:hypothetical protein N7535_002116 [Penicillium sp. DV-2018c]|nr:hypothetical protein N7535_002116 [Penicillium sp. DV-2018c]
MDQDQERQPLLPPPSTPQDQPPNHPSSSSPSPANTLLNSPIDTPSKPLTWPSAYILVISRVIGSGIFATPGSIVRETGSIGLTLLVWLVGTILSACGLAVSMEFGCMFPRSGGEKVYLEYTYPNPRFLASSLVAAQAVLLGFTASNCIVFARYVLFAFSVQPGENQHKALAVGLLTVITIVHGCFLKTGIFIQNVLGWVKIFLIGVMSLTGIWVVFFRGPTSPIGIGIGILNGAFGDNHTDISSTSMLKADADAFSWDTIWKDSNWSLGLLSTALFKVYYSYAGLNNVNNVLNEVRDPIGIVKTVCPSALLTAGVLYFLANLSYFLVIPLEEIKESGELVGALLFERLFGDQIGRVFFPLAIAVSAAGNVMVVTFALARLNQEISRQGFLPFQSLLSTSKPFNSPLGGLIVHYIPSALVIALPPQGDVYNFILDLEGYPGQMFALAVTVGLLILRYREPEPYLARPFKAWLPAVWLRVGVCLGLLVTPFIPPRGWNWRGEGGGLRFFYATYAVVGIAIVLSGVLYWYVWTVLLPRWGGYRLEEEKEILDDGTSIVKLVRVYK